MRYTIFGLVEQDKLTCTRKEKSLITLILYSLNMDSKRLVTKFPVIIALISTMIVLGLDSTISYRDLGAQSIIDQQTSNSECHDGVCTTFSAICNNSTCSTQKHTSESKSENSSSSIISNCNNGSCTSFSSICSNHKCINATKSATS